ncbi:MAG: NADH:ubiquinone reductase (Na(+)-transporting) subunit C [Myxococcales bacterium]|nr:MAG: NADH:ubiquinone reductase (Na(+)-transporting) subunit C [Myxococcales bacterium]
MPGGKTETVARTLLVAFLVSLVCSSLVASAAVLLKPRQVADALLDMRRNILEVAGLMEPEADVDELYESIDRRVVDLQTGAYVEGADLEGNPELGVVYLVRRDGEVSRIILPVSGYGLWSTLYGFLALRGDGNTIADITFYAHGETPGLGDFIAKPAWRELWRGKRAFDESGDLKIEVIKGRVPADDPLADYHVDGVSGATLTGNGVTKLLQRWLGDDGYGPYLRDLRDGGRP